MDVFISLIHTLNKLMEEKFQDEFPLKAQMVKVQYTLELIKLPLFSLKIRHLHLDSETFFYQFT